MTIFVSRELKCILERYMTWVVGRMVVWASSTLGSLGASRWSSSWQQNADAEGAYWSLFFVHLHRGYKKYETLTRYPLNKERYIDDIMLIICARTPGFLHLHAWLNLKILFCSRSFNFCFCRLLRPEIWSAVEGLVVAFAANDAHGMARNLIAGNSDNSTWLETQKKESCKSRVRPYLSKLTRLTPCSEFQSDYIFPSLTLRWYMLYGGTVFFVCFYESSHLDSCLAWGNGRNWSDSWRGIVGARCCQCPWQAWELGKLGKFGKLKECSRDFSMILVLTTCMILKYPLLMWSRYGIYNIHHLYLDCSVVVPNVLWNILPNFLLHFVSQFVTKLEVEGRQKQTEHRNVLTHRSLWVTGSPAWSQRRRSFFVCEIRRSSNISNISDTTCTGGLAGQRWSSCGWGHDSTIVPVFSSQKFR